jgi:hypothetical protein
MVFKWVFVYTYPGSMQTHNLVSATGCGFESLRRYPWKSAEFPWNPPSSLEPTGSRFAHRKAASSKPQWVYH